MITMIKEFLHSVPVGLNNEVQIGILLSYFKKNACNQELLDILLIDAGYLDFLIEYKGEVFIESITVEDKTVNDNIYTLHYSVPYTSVRNVSADIEKVYRTHISFTLCRTRIFFDASIPNIAVPLH